MDYLIKMIWDDGSKPHQNSNKYNVSKSIFEEILFKIVKYEREGKVTEV